MGIRIGDWNWGFGIRIGDWDWGLGLWIVIGDRDGGGIWYWHWELGFGIDFVTLVVTFGFDFLF